MPLAIFNVSTMWQPNIAAQASFVVIVPWIRAPSSANRRSFPTGLLPSLIHHAVITLLFLSQKGPIGGGKALAINAKLLTCMDYFLGRSDFDPQRVDFKTIALPTELNPQLPCNTE